MMSPRDKIRSALAAQRRWLRTVRVFRLDCGPDGYGLDFVPTKAGSDLALFAEWVRRAQRAGLPVVVDEDSPPLVWRRAVVDEVTVELGYAL